MIGAHIQSILIATGVLTAMAFIMVLAPAAVLRGICGTAAPADAISLALARHWGLLIFCVGVFIIYAAYHPAVRSPVMIFAAVEKIALGMGVLCTSLRAYPVAVTIAAGDTLIALVYVFYLTGF
jgi:hypothetical protein